MRALQRAPKVAASERPRGNGRPDAALQRERPRRALQLADARIAQGDINGVYALSKLMPLAMRYEKIARDAHVPREVAP